MVPIHSRVVAAFVIAPGPHILLMRRSSPYLHHNWQMVTGRIEKGEKAWQAALREIREETGFIPREMYAVDSLQHFYNWQQDIIHFIPVFAAFVQKAAPPQLNPAEHDQWKWAGYEEALEILEFRNQAESLMTVHKYFLEREPSAHLKIDMTRM